MRVPTAYGCQNFGAPLVSPPTGAYSAYGVGVPTVWVWVAPVVDEGGLA